MSTKSRPSENNSRPLEFRLSLESANCIKERIQNNDISILENISLPESYLESCGRIANEASRILLSKYQSKDKGCSTEESVKDWLNRKRGKKITVFKALCEAVDEDWRQVVDKSFFTEILNIKQEEITVLFADSIQEYFHPSFGDNTSIFEKYRHQIEEIFGSDKLEIDLFTELVETFINEFAINGRQIKLQVNYFSMLCPLIKVQVRGKNQNDVISTWNSCYDKPYPYTVEIQNWWWKGDININLKTLVNNQEVDYSFDIFVTEKGYKWVDILLDLNIDSDINWSKI